MNQLAAAKEAGDDLKISEMTDSIACVEAAKALQLDRVMGSQFVLLQDKVRTLQDEGHDIVQPSMVAITVVYVGEILDDSLLKKRCDTTLKKWSQCMKPCGDGGSWSVECPCFALTKAEHCEDGLLQQHWPQSVFGAVFWRLMANVGQGPQKELMVVWCEHFVVEMRDVQSSIKFQLTFDTVVSVVKAIWQLLNPEPGIATIDDVQLIFPVNATTSPLVQHLPKIGRALVAAFRKDPCNVWKDAHTRYQECVGPLEAAVTEYSQLKNDLQASIIYMEEISGIPVPDHAIAEQAAKSHTSVTEQVLEKVPGWQKSLPAGSCNVLVQRFGRLTDSAFHCLLAKGLDWVHAQSVLDAIKKGLPLVDDAGLTATISDQLLDWASSDTDARMKAMIEKLVAGDISEMLLAQIVKFSQAEFAARAQELQQSFVKVVDWLVKQTQQGRANAQTYLCFSGFVRKFDGTDETWWHELASVMAVLFAALRKQASDGRLNARQFAVDLGTLLKKIQAIHDSGTRNDSTQLPMMRAITQQIRDVDVAFFREKLQAQILSNTSALLQTVANCCSDLEKVARGGSKEGGAWYDNCGDTPISEFAIRALDKSAIDTQVIESRRLALEEASLLVMSFVLYEISSNSIRCRV